MKNTSHCSILLLFVLLLHLSSCQSDSKPPATESITEQDSSTIPTIEETNTAAQAPTTAIYMIGPTGFFGIQLGQTIVDIQEQTIERG